MTREFPVTHAHEVIFELNDADLDVASAGTSGFVLNGIASALCQMKLMGGYIYNSGTGYSFPVYCPKP